jgi:hypothetical protein
MRVRAIVLPRVVHIDILVSYGGDVWAESLLEFLPHRVPVSSGTSQDVTLLLKQL